MKRIHKKYKWLLGAGLVLLAIFSVLLLMANRFVAPMLRSRLHTLIVQGSDSLYRYELGNIKANFFGGSVAVENLHIQVDSVRYRQLDSLHALPSLTLQLDLQSGYVSGLSVFRLLFSKRIEVSEIGSKEANLQLSRHLRPEDVATTALPLWKALQPVIRGIRIDRINLDGIKLLYQHADTAQSVKLQFDRCEALFEDMRIDSVAALDSSRIVFSKNISARFNDLKFRTPDSTYKMEAQRIYYSSQNRYLELENFRLQPTLERADFYQVNSGGTNMYYLNTARAYFTNLQLDRFIHSNILIGDSMVLVKPEIRIYNDRSIPVAYVNKFGIYPHQRLLRAAIAIDMRVLRVEDGDILYTEKGEKTGKEGTLDLTRSSLLMHNVTNLPARIVQTPECTVDMQTHIFTSSPLQARFTFYLDSAEGAFAVQGQVRNITAAQLNKVAMPLGNVEVESGTIQEVQFALTGDDFTGRGQVQMQYSGFSIVLRKLDEETGALSTKKFLTRLINRFTLYPDNPGPDGQPRQATGIVYARPSNKSFFSTVWKTLFQGMQKIMLKSGVYE